MTFGGNGIDRSGRGERLLPAVALAASCHMQFVNYSWAEDPATARRKAVDLARRALQVACDDPDVIASAAPHRTQHPDMHGVKTANAHNAVAWDFQT